MSDAVLESCVSLPQRILIVRPSALGDVSRTVPVLVSLRGAFPKARIDWLVAESYADAVMHHPMLDGVICFARDRLSGFGFRPSATREGLALARKLRSGRYDLVYDCQGLFRSGLLTWLTRAPRRVGFADAREGAWLAYNARYRTGEGVRHTVDQMLGLIEEDGVAIQRDLRLYVGPGDEAWLKQFTFAHGLEEDGYACLAPTARWGCKCWPLERYGEIARRLLATGIAGRRVVVVAGPHEHGWVQPMMDQLERDGIDIDNDVIFPATGVGQMMALISQTRLLVCNDSAALHMAVGFNRPIATIFGPTDPAHVGPYGRDDCIIQPPPHSPGSSPNKSKHYRHHRDDAALISQVAVDTVWEKIEEQIAGHGGE